MKIPQREREVCICTELEWLNRIHGELLHYLGLNGGRLVGAAVGCASTEYQP